jgi:hypothetical protein
LQQLRPAAASKLRFSRSSSSLTTAVAGEVADEVAYGDPRTLGCSSSSGSGNVCAQGQGLDASQQASQQHLKSRMLWARALTKSKAVVRLLAAGQQHSSSSSGQQLQQAAGVHCESNS